MIKDFNTLWEILRATPVINLICLIINFIVNPTISSFYILAMYNINHAINFTLKELIVKPFYTVMNTDFIPIIGRGSRPPGATNCGSFLSLEQPISKSYGMPSGHSQLIWGLSTYLIFTLLKNQIVVSNNERLNNLYNTLLISFILLISILVSYSRVYKHNCHTIQQVIVGGLIGIIFGYITYYYKKSLINYFLKLNIF